MNNKDIKNKIKEQAISEMPDILHKIDLNSIDIEPVQEQVKSKAGFNLNYKLAFTTFLLIITGFLAFQFFNIPDSSYPLETDIEVLGFETVSAQALIEYSAIEETDLSYELSMNPQSEANDTEEYLNEITPMIELAELIINNKEYISYEEFESELSEYEKRIHFQAINLSNEEIEYDIYFNQTDDNITGKIVNGDFEYEFTKNNQSFKLYRNENEFIEVENSKANETHEFAYQYLKNQVEQFATSIKIEVQNNIYQAEFNYESNKGLKISLMMRRQNQNTMDVDYNIEDQAKKINGHFNVDVQNDQSTGKMMYRFIFNDSSTTQKDKSSRPMENNPGNSPHQDSPGNSPNQGSSRQNLFY